MTDTTNTDPAPEQDDIMDQFDKALEERPSDVAMSAFSIAYEILLEIKDLATMAEEAAAFFQANGGDVVMSHAGGAAMAYENVARSLRAVLASKGL